MNTIAKLTYDLAQSEFLTADDDLSTPQGVIAAAMAILERMAQQHARNTGGTWTPRHVLERRAVKLACGGAPAELAHASDRPDPIGGATITKPAPAPRAPRPGGAAVRLPSPAIAEIVF